MLVHRGASWRLQTDEGPLAPMKADAESARKTAAASAALKHVCAGMRLGIGTGSTADAFSRLLAQRIGQGLEIRCVATSTRTETLCAELGIQLTEFDQMPHLDLTVDGADEIDGDLNLVKGAGGALLREKIVASASDTMIVVADDTKLVEALGEFPLPIEIARFGLEATRIAIVQLAADLGMPTELNLRMDNGSPLVTDGGNHILDASFGRIRDANALADGLVHIPGVVEHGLFLGMADIAYVGTGTGVSRITRRDQRRTAKSR
jgi:ribose 5-phosphate isomerase A